jgi:hypothetical protein
VPGLGDDPLAEDDEQVVAGVLTPQAVPADGVVLGGGDGVRPGGAGAGRQLLHRQLPAVR